MDSTPAYVTDPETGDPVYAYKRSLVGAAFVFRLTADALEAYLGPRKLHVRYDAIRRVRHPEFHWAMVAFAGVVLLGTLTGIVVAVILSLLSLLHQANNPPVYAVLRRPGSTYFEAAAAGTTSPAAKAPSCKPCSTNRSSSPPTGRPSFPRRSGRSSTCSRCSTTRSSSASGPPAPARPTSPWLRR